MSLLEKWITDLPQQFKDKKNIEILIKSFSAQLEELHQVYEDLDNKTDLDTARGITLDHVGSIIALTRKEAGVLAGINMDEPVISDERYRHLLKYKILLNTNECTYKDIMTGIQYFYNGKIKYIEDSRYPATIFLKMEKVDADHADTILTKRTIIKASGVTIVFEKSYFSQSKLNIMMESRLIVNSNFYPRDNTEYLTLNGTWSLNDKYTINGYKSDKPVDFYPMGMQISTSIKNIVGGVSLQTYCTDLKTETSSKVCYQIKSDCNINTKEDTSIAIHTFVSKDIKNIAKQTYYTDLKVDLASSSENSIKTEYKVKAERENIVLIRSSSNVTSKVTSNVTVAKNVWKLDGSYRLDGSRIIPEKSEDYML